MNKIYTIPQLKKYKFTVFNDDKGYNLWSFEYFKTENEAAEFAKTWAAQ